MSTPPPESRFVSAEKRKSKFEPNYPSALDTGAEVALATDNPQPKNTNPTKGKSDVFDSVKSVLKLVEVASEGFPLAKPCITRLLELIDIIDLTFQNQQGFDELKRRIETVTSIINTHVPPKENALSDLFIRRLDGLSGAIHQQMFVLQKNLENGYDQILVDNGTDASNIDQVYRTLSLLFKTFAIDTAFPKTMTSPPTLSHGSSVVLQNLNPVPSAAYNACTPNHQRGCTENTRESILAKLLSWAVDPSDTKIYWLSGMAGTGKTAIGYSFCDTLDKNQMLGASFFCSRLDAPTSSANYIIPTLAHQLTQRLPSMCEFILPVIEGDSLIAAKPVQDQLRDIIVGPLCAMSRDFFKRPLVIAIEAVDECVDLDEVDRLLQAISQYSSTLPIKFFITSRPTQHISQVFDNQSFTKHSRLILHNVEKDGVKADIEVFVRARLKEIQMEKIQEGQISLDEWPPDQQVQIIVELAGNLFIFAAAACAYIAEGNVRERLTFILNISRGSMDGEMTMLDNLYNGIVTTAYTSANTRERETIKSILQAVTTTQRPLSVETLCALFSLSNEQVASAMSCLPFVIHISFSVDFNVPITTFHASFPDFITTESRAGLNLLERSESHRILALRCLTLMDSSLQENIFGLSGQPLNTEIRPELIRERISDALAYACTYWVHHATEASMDNSGSDLRSRLLHFFDHNVLRWIECLSVIGQLGTVMPFLRRLECHIQTDVKIWDAVMDTRRMVIENFEVISRQSLETYRSALVWLPENSRIRKIYTSKCPLRIIMGRRMRWDACEAVLVGHHAVAFVAFSPDGGRIVSGSESIRIWDAETGNLEWESKHYRHLGWLESVTVSPDCRRIASGYSTGTICVWGVAGQTKDIEMVAVGRGVESLAFSPDGNWVVSGSEDGCVRIWNAWTGECKVTMKGHSNRVWSVAFSTDGCRVVSGSEDTTIRVWDVRTKKCTIEMRGHLGVVRSVLFCPDGARIVSGSSDMNVGVWDAATGECEAMLEGHSGAVLSVALSSNGRVVSGSSDKTVRVWSMSIRECEAILEGHSDSVSSVAFSPDGTCIVSGSRDCSVRIWNTSAMRESKVDTPRHTEDAWSIELSPDGTRIASLSRDNTIRVWSVATGACEKTLDGAVGVVRLVAFSPDGRQLFSASDETAHIWNIDTGECEVMMKSPYISCCAFSSDGLLLVSGSDEEVVQIWDAQTGKSNFTLRGYPYLVACVALSPDGNFIASGSIDATVRLWNTRTRKSVAVLKGHSNTVTSVAFSPGGDYIVSRSSFDKTVRIWNMKTHKCEAELVRRDWTVETAVLSSVSTMLSAHRAIFPDGSTVYCDSDSLAIIPVWTAPSLCYDGEIINCREIDEWCWVPPRFRNPSEVRYQQSKIVFGYESGLVVALEYAP